MKAIEPPFFDNPWCVQSYCRTTGELVLRLPAFALDLGDLWLTPTSSKRGEAMFGRRNKNSDARIESDETEQDSVARRHLLRYGGIAAAGAAGAALLTAVDASPAGATGPLVGTSMGGIAVEGTDSSNGTGVQGNSDSGTGVEGTSNAAPGFGAAINGINNGGGLGIYGFSSGDDGIGMEGENSAGVRGIGVRGLTKAAGGYGVVGHGGTSGSGVLGLAFGSNPGVWGESLGTGPAMRATGAAIPASTGVGAGNGSALSVQGRAAFARSGILTIPAGASNALTGLIAGGLLAGSHVLATMQTVVATNASVKSAVPILSGTSKGKIQVFLTAAPRVA
jgi:hypothetical protein